MQEGAYHNEHVCKLTGRCCSNSFPEFFRFDSTPSLSSSSSVAFLNLRASPGENHAKPCRRCYRPDHRISSYFVCRYTLVNYLQIWYNFASSSFSLCLQGGSPREPFLYSFKTRDFIKFRCLAHP